MSTIAYAYNRFCIERFPLPDEKQFENLERQIDVQFPNDYRRYILDFNGGYFNDCSIACDNEECPQDGLRAMAGIGASHTEAELGNPAITSLFDENDPPQIMSIGRTTMGGLIAMMVRGEGYGEICLKQAWGGILLPCRKH